MANISDEEMEGLEISMDMGMSPPRAGPSSGSCPPGTFYGSPVASSSTYPDPTRRDRYEHLNLMNNLAKMQKLKRIRRQLEMNRTPPPMESPPTSPRRTPQGGAPCPMSPPPSPFQSPQAPWIPQTPPRRAPGSPQSPQSPRTPRTPQSPQIHGRGASSPQRAMPEGWVPIFADHVDLPDDLLEPVEFCPQQEEPLDLLQDNIPAGLPQALVAPPLRKGFLNVELFAEPCAEPGLNFSGEGMDFDSIEQISYEAELEEIERDNALQVPLVDPYFPYEPCEGQGEYEVEKKWQEFEEAEPVDLSTSFHEAPSYISIPSTKDTTKDSTKDITIPSFLHSTYSSMGSDAELFIEDEAEPGAFAMPSVTKIKDPAARFQRLKFLKDMHFRDMAEESFSTSVDEDFFIPVIPPADLLEEELQICPGGLDEELMDFDVSGASSMAAAEPDISELFEEDQPGNITMPYISMIQDPGARFQRLKLLKDMHRERSRRRDRVMPPMGRVPERRYSLDQRPIRSQVRRGSAPPGLLDDQGPIQMLFPRRHSLDIEQRPRGAIRSQVRRGSAPADFYDKRFPLPVIIDRRHSFSDGQRPRDSLGTQVRRGSAPPDLFDVLPPPPPLIFPGDIGDEEIQWDASDLMPDEPFEIERLPGVIEPGEFYSPDEETALRAAARRFIEIKHDPRMYYESHRPAMPPLPTVPSMPPLLTVPSLPTAQALDTTGFFEIDADMLADERLESFSSVGSADRLFFEDENVPGTYAMPGISSIQDPAQRFEKLRQLRSSHFGEVPADHFSQFVQNARILQRRESFGGRDQAREVFPGRLSGPPGMLEVLPSAPPLLRPGNILDESMDFGDVSETSALPSEPDLSNLMEESFDLDETIPEPVVYEFPDIVEREDAYSPDEEQAIRDAQRRFLEVKYNPEMYYPSQEFAHIPQRDRLFDESLPSESFEDWETMGAPAAAVLDEDEMSLINAISAIPEIRPRRLSQGLSPTRRVSQGRRLSGPPVFNLDMERRPVPDRIPSRVVGRVFDAQPCPDGFIDEEFDLVLDDSDLSGLENITRAPVTQGRYSFGLTPTKQRHRRRLSGPPDFNLERRARDQIGFMDTSMPEHDYSGVSDFFPPTTAQWAEEMFRTIGKPERRASYGGASGPQVCPGRRMSAPPEPIAPIDYFEMEPRRLVTRPRHSLGMTPTRPRAGRRLSVPLGINLQQEAYIPPECRAPPSDERFITEMPSLRHSFGEADVPRSLPPRRLSAPPTLDIAGPRMFGTLVEPRRRGSFGGDTGQRKYYPARRMSGPPNLQNFIDPRGPDQIRPSGMPRTRPDRRASFGGATGQRQVCPGRRMSAPPETIGPMDYFEMDPRRPVKGPRHSLGVTPTRPSDGRRLSAPPGLTYDQEGSLERTAKISFIDIANPDGGEQHISILSEGTRSPREVHFPPSPDRSLIEDVSFSFEDIEGLESSDEWDDQEVMELREIICGITTTPRMKRRTPIIPRTLPKMSPIAESNMMMPQRSFVPPPLPTPRPPTPPRPSAKRRLNMSRSPSESPSPPRPHPSQMSPLERMLEGLPSDDFGAPRRPDTSQVLASFTARASPAVCQPSGLQQPLVRSPPTLVRRSPDSGMRAPATICMPTPPSTGLRAPAATGMRTPAATGMRTPARTGMQIPAASGMRAPAATGMLTPAPPPPPSGVQTSALERMLEGIDDDFGATSRPDTSQVLASFAARASPTVCQPSGLQQPLARSPPTLVRRSPDSGMRAPATICMPTPPSTGLRAPAATGMRTPAPTGMRTPARTGMRIPAASGMRAPAATGMLTPAPPPPPFGVQTSALERMLEGIDDDFGAASRPDTSQVLASFAARASPAVCQPSGVQQPLKHSPPALVRRSPDSGMRAPATICMPTPPSTGLRAPAATGMRTPATTGMRTPTRTGMRIPAASGMQAPAATGMLTPAPPPPPSGVQTSALERMLEGIDEDFDATRRPDTSQVLASFAARASPAVCQPSGVQQPLERSPPALVRRSPDSGMRAPANICMRAPAATGMLTPAPPPPPSGVQTSALERMLEGIDEDFDAIRRPDTSQVLASFAARASPAVCQPSGVQQPLARSPPALVRRSPESGMRAPASICMQAPAATGMLTPAPSPPPSGVQTSALERMLNEDFDATRRPDTSQVLASFAARASPAVCQPSGVQQPLAYSTPALVRRSPDSGVRVPATICMPTPPSTGLRAPTATGMRTPATTGMRTPARTGMRIPAAFGMQVPAATGMLTPAPPPPASGVQTSALERMLDGIDDDFGATRRPDTSQVLASFAAAKVSPAVCQPQPSGLRQPPARPQPVPVRRTQVLRTPESGMRRPSQSGMPAPTIPCLPAPVFPTIITRTPVSRAPAATSMRTPAASGVRTPATTGMRAPTRSQPPSGMSALERMLEGKDNDFDTTSTPDPSQVLASFTGARASPAVCQPRPSGSRQPPARSQPTPVRRSQVLRTAPNPCTRAPSASAMRTPSSTAMRTPSQTSVRSNSATVVCPPAAGGQRSTVKSGKSTTTGGAVGTSRAGTRVSVVTKRISGVAKAGSTTALPSGRTMSALERMLEGLDNDFDTNRTDTSQVLASFDSARPGASQPQSQPSGSRQPSSGSRQPSSGSRQPRPSTSTKRK